MPAIKVPVKEYEFDVKGILSPMIVVQSFPPVELYQIWYDEILAPPVLMSGKTIDSQLKSSYVFEVVTDLLGIGG